MRIFTTTMNRTMAKSGMLLLVIVLSVVGCKRDVVLPEVELEVDENELTLTATQQQPQGPQFAAPTRPSTSLDEFTTGSAISLYVQLKSESDAGSNTVLKSNSHYRYDQPIWQPQTKADKLMYHESEPVYIFGLYPHPDMEASTTTIDAGSTIANYTMHKDQSLAENAKASDLLWVGAKNTDAGYRRQYTPVNLVFQHMLCKVSFYIKLIDSEPQEGVVQKVSLKSLETVGSQISNQAELDILKGVLTPQYEADKIDSIRWESAEIAGIPLTVDGDAVHITDMLLIPFVAQAEQNKFRYVLYYPLLDLNLNYTTKIPAYDPSATGNQAGKMQFVSNKHNKVTVTIDISTAYTNITASIEPWGVGTSTDLPSEPE